MTRFTIAKCRQTGDFEIVAWRNKIPLVVQTNIRTRVKAEEARRFWRDLTQRDVDAAEDKIFRAIEEGQDDPRA